MIERPFEPCSRFDFDRLYHGEKYSLQNMLLKEVNMPSFAYPGEWVNDVWSDHSHAAFWDNAKSLIKSHHTGDAFFAGATDQSFLEWAIAVMSKVEGKVVPLTGAAVIRYTNVSSGYPTLRLTGIVATENLDGRRYGITKPERLTVSMYGTEMESMSHEY